MRHAEDDPALGQPLCPDYYDYVSHVIWQWWAPDLWRRFTITLRRLVAKRLGVPVTRLGDVATVQYAKVAEYQLRGVVHFHALVRLDGPRTPDGFAPAPATLDTGTLAVLIQQAAAGRALSPGQVAGYLAKYATKSVTDTTDQTGGDNRHHKRIRATTRRLALRAKTADATTASNTATKSAATELGPYQLLGKWVHMLGFRGHFATKSRRYSITPGALRRARRRAQALITESHATGRPLDLAALEADLLAGRDRRDHSGHRPLELRRRRLGHRHPTPPRHRRRRPRPRVRPVASSTAEQGAPAEDDVRREQ